MLGSLSRNFLFKIFLIRVINNIFRKMTAAVKKLLLLYPLLVAMDILDENKKLTEAFWLHIVIFYKYILLVKNA
jgi:hypothetical protein